YYYPTSAGHGIDIYFIDTGLNTDHIDFFDYEGFDFNRTVTYTSYYQNPYHGTAVASVAAGMIFGASQKANIHMIAVDLSVISVLRSFDYILLNAKPHKTIINMSFSGGSPYYQANEDKLSELIEKGFILFTSAGNERENCCAPKESEDFHAIAGYRKAITVSAAFSNFRSKGYTMEDFANYGDCVDIFAPGFVAAAYATESRLSYYPMEGTSFSSPLAAGVAATIMS
ncbi:subtilisin-like protein, partial [Anaeromyces robustus]